MIFSEILKDFRDKTGQLIFIISKKKLTCKVPDDDEEEAKFAETLALQKKEKRTSGFIFLFLSYKSMISGLPRINFIRLADLALLPW